MGVASVGAAGMAEGIAAFTVVDMAADGTEVAAGMAAAAVGAVVVGADPLRPLSSAASRSVSPFALFNIATRTPGGFVDFDYYRISGQITGSK